MGQRVRESNDTHAQGGCIDVSTDQLAALQAVRSTSHLVVKRTSSRNPNGHPQGGLFGVSYMKPNMDMKEFA